MPHATPRATSHAASHAAAHAAAHAESRFESCHTPLTHISVYTWPTLTTTMEEQEEKAESEIGWAGAAWRTGRVGAEHCHALLSAKFSVSK